MSEGREGISGVQETEEESGILETEDLTETEETSDEPEYKPGESAKETAARILGEENEVSGDETESDAPAEGDVNVERVKTSKKKDSDEDYDAELIAPARLNPAEAKMFQNLPKGLKRAFHRAVKNVEGQGTRTQQQAAQIVQKWGNLEQQLMPYAQGWAERGISLPAGLLQLAATQKKLTDADPQVREDTYLRLARQSKVDIAKLANKILGRTGEDAVSGSIPDISNHPLVQELKNEIAGLRHQLDPVLSHHQQQQESYTNEIAEGIVSEIEAVRKEVDTSSGQYRYPKLYESDFLESAKPLVLALKRAAPGLSWGDAYRKAYATMTGQPEYGASFQPPTRLGASNGNIASRATSAAITVRGRSQPSVGTTDLEPPSDVLRKGSQATMAWINANIGRGG